MEKIADFLFQRGIAYSQARGHHSVDNQIEAVELPASPTHSPI